jgi:serine/threonine-protein kinase
MLVGQQIGPFEIEKELGCGAMGTVYRAKFRRSADKVVPVALKVVALGLLGNESAMARFEREANILKQLRHPHIVRLIAHGKIHRQNPYIAMEYIDGEALDRALARRGRLSWEEVTAYGRQLCDALQYAHDKGIIHRDLKPSNLMLTRESVLKLTDFGIAKDADVTALTGANSTIGTAAYMSPEQCRGDRNLSNKSDLYSLGIVFFELLAGRKPFMAETTVEMFLKHVNDKPPRIDKLVPELPPRLAQLILQLLEKHPEDRPIDAAWVGRMLQEVEEDAFARKSAGLAVAQARTVKPRTPDGERLDEADKEAARALRGGRKKKKKAAVPLLQQKWVQAAGLAAVLVGIAAGVYLLAFRGPSAEKLYAAVQAAGPPESKVEAARRFLDAYGAKGGPQADATAAAYRTAVVNVRERQLTKRFQGKMEKPADGDDAQAYAAAWEALAAERAGYLAAAETHWTKVKGRFPDEGKLPFATDDEQLAKARWGWLADKRLADLAAAKVELNKLYQKIDTYRAVEQSFKNDAADPEAVLIRALRLHKFEDDEAAGRECDALLTLTEKDPDRHVWALLGAQLKSGLKKYTADPTEARVALLGKWLDSAEREANEVKGDPSANPAARRAVRNTCRDVIDLYDDDPTPAVREAVTRARKIAALVPQ